MINLTEAAATEIKSIITNHASENALDPNALRLRVGVRGGGCGGFSYILDLTDVDDETCERFEVNGVTILCDPKSHLYLDGTTIDFRNEVMGRGFTFNNPNATSSCGCGSSFSA